MRSRKRKYALRLVSVLAACLLLLPPEAWVSAQEGGQSAERIRQELARARNDRAKLERALRQAERALAEVEAELESLQQQQLEAKARAEQAKRELNTAAQRMAALKAVIGSRARNVYISGDATNLSALMVSGNADQLLDQLTILEHLARGDNQALEDLQVARRAAQAAQVELAEASRERQRAIAALQPRLQKADELVEVRFQAKVRLDEQVRKLEGDLAVQLLNETTPSVPQGSGYCTPRGSAAARNLVYRESRWNPYAKNPNSTAFGLGQLLIGNRIKYLGDNYNTVDCDLQFQAFTQYCIDRYGSVEAAWAFWQEHHWY